MKSVLRVAYLVLFAAIAGAPIAGSEAAPKDIGMVLIHGGALIPEDPALAKGKGKPPTDNTWSLFNRNQFADALVKEGYQVVRGVFPWAPFRNWDATMPAGMKELDASIAKLRASGAGKIVLVGESMGANVALLYAVAKPEIAGVVVTSIGPGPDNWPEVEAAYTSAKEAIAKGDGDKIYFLPGTNSGTTPYKARVTPRIWYSYYGPEGFLPWDKAYRELRADMPVLFVIGGHDKAGIDKMAKVFDRSKEPAHRSYEIVADAQHFDIMVKSTPVVIPWLKQTFP